MNLRYILYIAALSLAFAGTSEAQVRFDANFESGNMQSVTTTDSVTYTVRTRADIGGRWFYFRMTGVKNRFVRVKVSNSDVKRAMYSYDDRTYQRFTLSESPATNTFEKTYSADTVWAAYYTPYTLTSLNARVHSWLTDSRCALDTIGYTKKNLPLYDITVTDRSIPDSLKEHVWIHARTHPGETPSSWQFEGIMNTLLSGGEVIGFYLKHLVFHCIPFTNPDGVYYGRSRTNYDSVDVESNWNKADSLTCREVLLLKKHMAKINQKKVLKVFLNLHSQAVPYCTFWIHTAASTSSFFYRREMQFCNLNISDNPYFRFSDFSYSALSPTFPEGWQWKNWGDATMALTYETPYDYYSTGAPVDNANLAALGERAVYALAEFLELSHPKRLLLDAQASAAWMADTAGTDYFGSNYLTRTGGNGASPAVYHSGAMPPGSYDVYGWWPAAAGNCANVVIRAMAGTAFEKIVDQRANGGKWNLLGSVSLFSPGETVLTVSDSGSGRIAADAFRLVHRGAASSIEAAGLPGGFSVSQNYPNPFNTATKIIYSVPAAALPLRVTLKVFDILGTEVRVLRDTEQLPGRYEIGFDASGLPSGIYLYRLTAGSAAFTRKMMLLK